MKDRNIELNRISNIMCQAVWNGEHENSQGYIVDLSNVSDVINIYAKVVEVVHEDFRPESYYLINNETVEYEKALEKYDKMKNPYVFNNREYNNLIKLPKHTQKLFLDNLLELEKNLETVSSKQERACELRYVMSKKEKEIKNLYTETENLDNEYLKLSDKKKQNNILINNYLSKVKINNFNILNKILKKKEFIEKNNLYKRLAVELEKENINNTAESIEKLLKKNNINKKIKEVENELDNLKKEYKVECSIDGKKTEILQEKNILFKVFYIDSENVKEREQEQTIEINEVEEQSE